MSDNGVAAVNDTGVITALIEHTHVQSENICQIYSTVCAAFIRADSHHMLSVDLQVVYRTEKPLDKLVSR